MLKPHACDARLRPPVCSGLTIGWFARNTPVITLEQVGNVRESRGVRTEMAASSSYPARSTLTVHYEFVVRKRAGEIKLSKY